MEHSLKTGLSFGSSSGIITTLGLMVGLHSGTGSQLAVIGGILVIAIADAFSDAVGIHISEESENKHTPLQIWMATLFTFFFKFVFSIIFLVPVLLFKLPIAVIISVIWGLSLLCVFSFYLAKQQGEQPWKVILEHLLIALAVIVITHFVGDWVKIRFG
jgi:VIT1/CCC1 family predicted Fe2+/Mn2+ transporter